MMRLEPTRSRLDGQPPRLWDPMGGASNPKDM